MSDMEVVADVEEVEEVDAFRYEFDELEAAFTKAAVATRGSFTDRYEAVLASSKDDEDAIKIKEAAVYRLAR